MKTNILNRNTNQPTDQHPALTSKHYSRTPVEKEHDYADIARLYLEGKTTHAISEWICQNRPYPLGRRQVVADLKKIRDLWKESYLKDYDAAKAKELARIDALEKNYWEAWERSQKEKEFTESLSVSDRHAGKGGQATQSYERSKAVHKKETRDGEARFLEGIERCVKLRCDILGLNEPKRVQVDWRQEAINRGLDPDTVKEDLVAQFMGYAEKGLIKLGEDDLDGNDNLS